eukprot:4165585-Karenia_brevis.AAC.1
MATMRTNISNVQATIGDVQKSQSNGFARLESLLFGSRGGVNTNNGVAGGQPADGKDDANDDNSGGPQVDLDMHNNFITSFGFKSDLATFCPVTPAVGESIDLQKWWKRVSTLK